MKKVAAEEGIVAIGYDKQYGEYKRLYQFAKSLLFTPSSGLYSCPIAMTDGAAKTIQTLGIKKLDFAFKRLTSRDPSEFWTSGQWMTERGGGSDVGTGTETVAIPKSDGKYTLHGYKWFSSATDSDMAITLARVANSDGTVNPGSSGVSMFFLKTRNDDKNGSLNNIQVMKLKNKLGTRQLPTGELLLDGTEAELISDFGRGIPSITPMLTSTRIQNATASVSGMRRILNLARDYSKRRVCFGLPIAKYPLHINTMAQLELETRGGTSLLMETVRMLGRSEEGTNEPDEEHILRLLTPVLKLYTAKKGMSVMSEGLELFGGQGYIEDTGIPKHFRDAQVLPIWEGTTNILSLDVLRAIGKSKGETLNAFERNLKKRLKQSETARPELSSSVSSVGNQLDKLIRTLREHLVQESAARLYAFAIGDVAIGTFLLEHAASKAADKTDLTAAIRWAQHIPKFEELLARHETQPDTDSNELVFDCYENTD
ncbi:acyl-CoA dehydrogenase family member 11 isoform X2 [Folsomia candida]|nr:acyl-CoA dehydrogenase family member 11 isoform X2 [Folsomia candida]